MNFETIANLIPKEYRDEILKMDMISRAVGIPSDNCMYYLFTIWKQYVEPDIGNCPLCFQRVLENYRKLQQTFIDMKVNEELLKEA
jgi:hypothetical protein